MTAISSEVEPKSPFSAYDSSDCHCRDARSKRWDTPVPVTRPLTDSRTEGRYRGRPDVSPERIEIARALAWLAPARRHEDTDEDAARGRARQSHGKSFAGEPLCGGVHVHDGWCLPAPQLRLRARTDGRTNRTAGLEDSLFDVRWAGTRGM